MDRNNEFFNQNNNLSNFNNVDTQILNFSLSSNDDLTHLGKLKNELRENLEFLENKLKNEPTSEQDWQVVISYRNNTKIKLNSVNSQVTQLLKQYSTGGNGVKYVQVQRFGGIFDQLTSEFNHVGKQLDNKYQRFMLFSSPNNYYTEGDGSNKVFSSGKVIVGAIRDVESLADQANLNLELLKKGNRRLSKIYNRVNTLVNKHLFDVHKLQKNISFVMARNKAIFAIILGIFFFFILCKLFSRFF